MPVLQGENKAHRAGGAIDLLLPFVSEIGFVVRGRCHADDAEAFAPNAVAQHPGGGPAGPVLIRRQDLGAFHQPARHGQDQRHVCIPAEIFSARPWCDA